ncbi:hypothetical protein HY407_00010 [Candidatus Gottesmanbacteria bacterium]|nr:hypothetical protein [Candidatus Gottesmanbacteria bacterium]
MITKKDLNDAIETAIVQIIESVSKALENLATKDEMDGGFQKIDKRLHGVEKRLDGIDLKLTDLRRDVNDIKADFVTSKEFEDLKDELKN